MWPPRGSHKGCPYGACTRDPLSATAANYHRIALNDSAHCQVRPPEGRTTNRAVLARSSAFRRPGCRLARRRIAESHLAHGTSRLGISQGRRSSTCCAPARSDPHPWSLNRVLDTAPPPATMPARPGLPYQPNPTARKAPNVRSLPANRSPVGGSRGHDNAACAGGDADRGGAGQRAELALRCVALSRESATSPFAPRGLLLAHISAARPRPPAKVFTFARESEHLEAEPRGLRLRPRGRSPARQGRGRAPGRRSAPRGP